MALAYYLCQPGVLQGSVRQPPVIILHLSLQTDGGNIHWIRMKLGPVSIRLVKGINWFYKEPAERDFSRVKFMLNGGTAAYVTDYHATQTQQHPHWLIGNT